jgi:hypothetical protein
MPNIIAKPTEYITRVASSENCDLNILQKHFYRIIDNIIQYNNFTETVTDLQNMLESVECYMDYYNLLDCIETNILSVVCNIIDNTSAGIIQTRVDYIKTIIDKLSSNCQQDCEVPSMFLQLIDLLINQVDLKTISQNILDIQFYLNTTYSHLDLIHEIQNILLGVVTNIGEGTPNGIISCRIEYVRGLIRQI